MAIRTLQTYRLHIGDKLAVPRLRWCLVLAHVLFLLACASPLPKATPYSERIVRDNLPKENQLIDVGIVIFQYDLDRIDDPDMEFLLARIREAESRFMPFLLKQTLLQGAQWGDIKILAEQDVGFGLLIQGKIIESNGHTLKLNISVADASGEQWFKKDYVEHIDKNVFTLNNLGADDPFQGIYTRIANDLLLYRESHLDRQSITHINNLANVQFAARFSPAVFGRYTIIDKDNKQSLIGLPAENDPIVKRIEKIRVRDDAFHDVMQQYYAKFSRHISNTYYQWRYEDFHERLRLRQQQTAAGGELVKGTMWIVFSVALGKVSNIWRRLGFVGAASYGGKSIVKGLDGLAVSDDFLKELAASFGDSVTTQIVELEDRSIQLSGTVEQQYAQWREILEQIYAIETGIAAPQKNSNPVSIPVEAN